MHLHIIANHANVRPEDRCFAWFAERWPSTLECTINSPTNGDRIRHTKYIRPHESDCFRFQFTRSENIYFEFNCSSGPIKMNNLVPSILYEFYNCLQICDSISWQAQWNSLMYACSDKHVICIWTFNLGCWKIDLSVVQLREPLTWSNPRTNHRL